MCRTPNVECDRSRQANPTRSLFPLLRVVCHLGMSGFGLAPFQLYYSHSLFQHTAFRLCARASRLTHPYTKQTDSVNHTRSKQAAYAFDCKLALSHHCASRTIRRRVRAICYCVSCVCSVRLTMLNRWLRVYDCTRSMRSVVEAIDRLV